MVDDQSARPSPERIIDTFQAFHRTAAVKAGVRRAWNSTFSQRLVKGPMPHTRSRYAARRRSAAFASSATTWSSLAFSRRRGRPLEHLALASGSSGVGPYADGHLSRASWD